MNEIEFIDAISPTELHLLLDTVNIIFSDLEKQSSIALVWAKEFCLVRESFNGGEFNGNSCFPLLKNTDKLQNLAENCYFLNVLLYVKAFRSFNNVVETCFGVEPKTGFEENINQFKKKLLAMNLNTTPKIHAIFIHVSYFYKKYNKEMVWDFIVNKPLNLSMQIFKVLSEYKVLENHHNYEQRSLKAVIEYNSKHIQNNFIIWLFFIIEKIK